MSEHTPGPWVAGTYFAKRHGGRTYIPILRPGNDPVPIAVVHRDVDGYGRGEGEANARLFEAAPDLLAHANADLAELEYYVGNPSAWDSYDNAMSERLHKIVERARAVIAKAAAPKQPGAK